MSKQIQKSFSLIRTEECHATPFIIFISKYKLTIKYYRYDKVHYHLILQSFFIKTNTNLDKLAIYKVPDYFQKNLSFHWYFWHIEALPLSTKTFEISPPIPPEYSQNNLTIDLYHLSFVRATFTNLLLTSKTSLFSHTEVGNPGRVICGFSAHLKMDGL